MFTQGLEKINNKINKITYLLSKKKNPPPVCENVKDWCKHQSETTCKIVKESIIESQVILRKPPNTIESEIHPKYISKSKYVTPEKYLVCINDVKIVGPNGLVILPDGSYSVEVAMAKFHLEKMPEYSTKLIEKYKIFKKPGKYYSLLQLFSNGHNYYHWIHDILQKIYKIKEFLSTDIVYLVPKPLKQWQYEALDIIGVKSENTRIFPQNEIWLLESLYFSPPTTISGHDIPSANAWIQNLFYQKYGVNASSINRNKKIYISRRLAKKGRKIINETEVESVLKSYGFKTYLLEKMSLREQVILFAQAKIVIAPHGAGLTNLIFSQPETTVLEIFEPSTFSTLCYYSLSSSMNHNYWYLFGKKVFNISSSSVPNVLVPIDKLVNFLQLMLP